MRRAAPAKVARNGLLGLCLLLGLAGCDTVSEWFGEDDPPAGAG